MKKLLPYIVALVVFGAVTMVMFAPQFEGRTLVMHDVVQYEGSATDIIAQQKASGDDPQWTGNSFAGMPAYLINIKYPGQIFAQAWKVLEFMGRPASLVFMAMVAFFVMLVLMRCNPWVAIAPALAYGLSTYFVIIIAVGHITKMVALAYAPLLVGGVWFTMRRNIWLGAALSALFGALLIAANHPQIVYYFMFILVALWISELVRAVRRKLLPRWAKATGALAIAGVFAVGANLAPLWYMQEYSKESIRGGSELSSGQQGSGLDIDYATQWSYGVGETLNLYVPYLYGGSSEGNFAPDGRVAEAWAQAIAKENRVNAENPQVRRYAEEITADMPSYWGPQPMTSGPTYLGAVALFLAVLALFMLPRRRTWWIAGVSLVAIMLAWGSNFMWFTQLFFDYFPAYDKFRTVSMILVIVEWTVPLLAAMALMKLWAGAEPDKLKKALRNTLYVLGGISLFLLLFGGSVFDFSAPFDSQLPEEIQRAMRSERASMMRGDAWRSLWLVALGAAIVVVYAMGKLRRGWVVAAFVVLMVADMAAVDTRFFNHSKFVARRNTEIKPTAADLEIMADKELGYRVLNLTVSPFNDATTSAFHRSVGGYSAAKLQRYQDVIDRYLAVGDPAVLDMLNVKYVITPEGVVQSPAANGAAWLVESVETVATADEEIAALGTLDLKQAAVARVEVSPTPVDSAAHISLVEYRPNYLKYDYSSPVAATAVFSEIYYARGWQAYIDGRPAPHFRADYILRAMSLPAGEHTVEFRFRSLNFGAVNTATLVCSIIILLGVAIASIIYARQEIKK
jgi:hypothetical protein